MSACIVTGVAAGNGLAIGRKLRSKGHFVVGIDRAAIPDDAADEAVTGDILDADVMRTAFARALAQAAGVLHLIHNAGITRPEFPQSDATWEATLDVNLTGPFRWSREFAARLAAGEFREGGMVFIGSLATERGFPKNAAYQASKAGVAALARAFACDLGPAGIRVNCVSPGYIHTAMTEGSYRDPKLNAARRQHTLIGRWGKPEDVANAVAFLCDPDSDYITGINLPVDGGWLANGLVGGA